MLPTSYIEIRTQLTIGTHEKVLVELRRHTGGIVVGALENISIFLEINADEQTSAVASEVHQAREKLARGFGLEIANGRPGKVNDGPRRESARQWQLEWFQIINPNRQDLQGGRSEERRVGKEWR